MHYDSAARSLLSSVVEELASRVELEHAMKSSTSYYALAAMGAWTLACSSGTEPQAPAAPPGATAGAAQGGASSAAGSSSAAAGTATASPTPGGNGTGGGTAQAGASGGGTGGAPGVGGGAGEGGSPGGGVSNGGVSNGGVSNGGTGGGAGSLGNGGMSMAGTAGMGTGMVPGETKATVTAPASSKVPSDYFVLGEARLLNNNWGAQELGCKAPYEIYVNADKTFGWKWDRASTTCGGNKSKPDYPEVEFGMHPFGVSEQLITSPDYSSTTILPIQVKDVTSASVKIEGLSIATTSDAAWNMNFEMWFCEQHPATGTHTTAYGETMNWFGWSSDQYNWNGVLGSLEAGQSYDLLHTDDHWPAGQAQQWKYRQYRLKSSTKQFNGTVDVKKILEHLVGQGWPTNLWIARFEVGTELDDGSAGTVSIKKITFEVNGQQRATEVR
jgi:Glycosyl hydrolase family 12